ncbi:hypothetical protein ACFLV7_01705 [Chloroflexota bacterium]
MNNLLHTDINEIIYLIIYFNTLDDHGGVEGEVVGDPFGGRVFPGRGSPAICDYPP